MPNIIFRNGTHGLASLTPAETNQRPISDYKLIDYKSHFLVGIRKDTGNAQMLAGWGHLPTKDELDKAIKSQPHAFVQLALCNATGFWSTEA